MPIQKTRPTYDVASDAEKLRAVLRSKADPALAETAQRYFPHRIDTLGVTNTEVMRIADAFVAGHADLSDKDRLALAEALICGGGPHEHVLLGFALVRKAVKRSYDDSLLKRFRYWLEHHVSNWAQCDDLCLKVIYPFFLGRPQLITSIQPWTNSKSPWVRRAANVALIKFVKRKIGKTMYELPLEVVFENTRRLLADPDTYVQKSVGWLLKATAEYHQAEVVGFIKANVGKMQRGTLRYAIEKMGEQQRKTLMALEH
jgi:3-methyladenine DNA glycosylase AlkD